MNRTSVTGTKTGDSGAGQCQLPRTDRVATGRVLLPRVYVREHFSIKMNHVEKKEK